jgi:hypothetical protein
MVRVRIACYLSLGSADPTNTLGTLDLLTFGFIIFFARKSKVPGFKIPTLLDTIAEDATRYFLVIFTSHLVFVITLNLGRVSPAILISGLYTMM